MIRMNQNYIIINEINVGDAEFVLGFNPDAPSKYVTWECKNGDNYFIGHYFSDRLKAQKDLCLRGLNEAKHLERHNNKNKDMER